MATGRAALPSEGRRRYASPRRLQHAAQTRAAVLAAARLFDENGWAGSAWPWRSPCSASAGTSASSRGRRFATGLAMQGTARLAEDHPEIADRLQRHVDDLDATIRDMRSAIFKIEVARSSGTSLRREVLDLVAGSSRVLGFEPAVHLDGPIDTAVPADVAGQLLPVLREALSNIARHAGATRVDVCVCVDVDLLLQVADDGVGGVVESGGGNGLRNTTHRAEQLGGSAHISRPADGGTLLEWVVPLQA